MTLTEILAAILANHQRKTQGGSDTKGVQARVGVKLAIQQIPKFHDFEICRTSTDVPLQVEDGSIDLPDGMLKLLEVRFMNGLLSYKIPLVNRERVTAMYPDVDTLASSYPEWVYIEGSKLYMAPRTAFAESLRLQYNTLPSFDATDDGSSLTPAIPLIDQYLIEYGTGWVFRSLQMFNESNVWMSNAVASLQASILFDLRKPGEDRRLQPFSPRDLIPALDPTDPFNFEPNSVMSY